MKQFKIFFLLSCLFIIPLCGAASASELKLADIALPCGQFGSSALMPISFANTAPAPGQITPTVAGVSTDITFNEDYLTFTGATIGPAGSAAGKNISYNQLSPGIVRVGVFADGNTTAIGNGVVAYVNFTLKKNPVGGTDLSNNCSASDPAGNAVSISCVSGSFFTAKTGDLNLDGTVSITELISVVGMFLSLPSATYDPIADPGGDGKVTVDDVIKAINCFLETKECACPTVDVIPQEELWKGSGHADNTAEAFNHWNTCTPVAPATTCTPSIPTSCAKCHSTPGYLDYLGADGTAAGVVNNTAPIGTVITCQACHNPQASELSSVVFESTGNSAVTPVIPKITISGLGGEARCMVCHQGRASTYTVDAKVGTKPLDTVDATLTFTNIHYFPAAATLYGGQVKGGYQYSGKIYDIKFAHVEGYDTCITCHDPHSLEVKADKCQTCHTNLDLTSKASIATTLRAIRMKGSLEDYDGDGNITEGIAAELDGLRAKLYQAIQNYADKVALVKIVYNPAQYPYFLIDANGNGIADPSETTGFNAFTPRLLKACYNYQMSVKDPGAFAHNAKYMIELLYDSTEDLNIQLSTLVPSAAVDISKCNRSDEGHFNGASEAWRHWDTATAPALPGPTGSCAKCHSAKGIPFFITNGVNIQGDPANGMLCLNCHSSVTDTVAPRRAVASVVFPSGLKVSLPNPLAASNLDSNLCMLCHQGRAWKGTVDAAAPVAPATTISFTNVHYYAAAASLFGTDVQAGYEYTGKTYAGKNTYSSHGGQFNTCVQCHMGSNSLNADYKSHKVTTPNPNNCVCHFGDVSQTPGNFQFANIRPATGFGSTDFDADGNVTESLNSEINGLEDLLYAQIKAYALANGGTAIVYDAATNPYWFVDTNGDGIHQATETTKFGFPTNKTLLKACYNYQVSQKEPCGYIHNALYIAQLLVDSYADLGGTRVFAWR